MNYCVANDGSKLSDVVVKDLILNAPFKTAYFIVCKYITKRDLLPLHMKILKQNSDSKKSLQLAPRGHGKSTVGDVDFNITKILREPNIRIMIGSKTQTQAEAFLKEIRTHFDMNEDLIRIFGELKSDNWNNREFTVKTRTKIVKEATVTALGASGAVVSKHFDLIIGDDLVGFENARTELQRTKLREWFYSSLYPTLEPHGEIHILGTRYHPLDLYGYMISLNDYDVVKQSAINIFSSKDKQHSNYIKRGLLDNDIKDGEEFSLWEDKFSIDILKGIKAEAGVITFGMQYQNDVELAKGNIFKPQYFKYFSEYNVDYDSNKAYVRVQNEEGEYEKREVNIFFGVDLAISEKESADYFVLFIIGVDKDKNIYCLDYIKDRLSFDKQMNTIIMYGEVKFPMVLRIGIESVAYQAALVGELRRNTHLPIIGLKTNKDKVTRAIRRSALFETGKVWLNESMKEFEEMLLLFPEVEHDKILLCINPINSVKPLNKGQYRARLVN